MAAIVAWFLRDDEMPPSLDQILPHKNPMILLNRLGKLVEDGLECYVDISNNSKFFDGEGVPNYVGLEYMAQTVAAYAGYHAFLKKEKVKEGFLLGSRDVTFTKLKYLLNDSLRITCKEFMHNDEMGVFDCSIINAKTDVIYSSCKLNVFQPEDPSAFFNHHE